MIMLRSKTSLLVAALAALVSTLCSGCSDSGSSSDFASDWSPPPSSPIDDANPETNSVPKRSPQAELVQAILDIDAAGVREAIRAGADVNKTSPEFDQGQGDSPLFMAVYRGDRNIVKLLIKAGAKINARGATSEGTVLDESIRQGHTKLSKYLRSLGARATGEGQRDQRISPFLHNDHWDHPSPL